MYFNDMMLGIITILGMVLTYFVVPILKEKKLYDFVKILVQSAEQLYKGKGLGEQKKEFVVQKLKKFGIEVNNEQLDILIESAVLELNKSFGER